MKKIYIVLTLLFVLLLLASCGKTQSQDETVPTPATPESTTASVESVPVETMFEDPPADTDDGKFPVFAVGYYAGNEFVLIKSTDELAQCLSMFANLCGEDKTYRGMGVYLYGYEVQKSDISGIPYCHLSYGSKDDPMTVMGFGHDVLDELDANLVVDLLMICPYFTRVEFFPTVDPTKPAG